MSGNFTPLPISNGQLPNAQASLIVAPGGTNYYLKQFFLYNENATLQTIQLWLFPNGGAAELYKQLQLAQNESADILEHGESITLTPGDAIQAVTTTAAAVDYHFTGVQET